MKRGKAAVPTVPVQRGYRIGIAFLLIAAAGCQTILGLDEPTYDPGRSETTYDASPPAPSPRPPAAEVTSGGMKVRGTTYSVDVQIGHPMPQSPVRGNTTVVEGAALVKP